MAPKMIIMGGREQRKAKRNILKVFIGFLLWFGGLVLSLDKARHAPVSILIIVYQALLDEAVNKVGPLFHPVMRVNAVPLGLLLSDARHNLFLESSDNLLFSD